MTSDAEAASYRLFVRPEFAASFDREARRLPDELRSFMITSSGWRKVFAADEESGDSSISEANAEIVAVSASVFARFIKEKSGEAPWVVALATDTRPTGPAIAGVMARALLAEGVTVRFLRVAAAPEIMAYARVAKLAGFAYVTASHNPIGHNGFKFGLSDGGVLGAADSQALALAFGETIQDAGRCAEIRSQASRVESARLEALYEESSRWKSAAIEAYLRFTREVVTGYSDPEKQEELLAELADGAKRRGIGVVAELNGSARTRSIDESFLKSLGVKVRVVNGEPGRIVHRIVPEGASLAQCSEELERAHASDRGYLLGYVPDNDGDRGNIVFFNARSGRGEILHAQEVFALCCVAELAYLVYSGKLTYNGSGKAVQKVAVVVNDPTSLRIEAIAKAFDARVFRAEVGEANVVNLARDSRKSGFVVRILGEGSNGGNITHPAAVRDPINTLSAFLKLLLLDSAPGAPGLYEIWCRRSGQEYAPGSGFAEMVASLPKFATTDIYESRALLDVRTQDQIALKERFEEIFSQDWEERRDELRDRFAISSWEEINYEGINEVHGFGRTYRSGKQRGGLKILFKDESGRGIAFIWMRGSNTEPVFRILADVRGGNSADEAWLLSWLVSMLRRAEDAIPAAKP